jgi:hypothetical protein
MATSVRFRRFLISSRDLEAVPELLDRRSSMENPGSRPVTAVNGMIEVVEFIVEL